MTIGLFGCTTRSGEVILSNEKLGGGYLSSGCGHSRYAPRRLAGEGHQEGQGRLCCNRLVMATQPPSAENGTSQSDVDIPDERDRRYRSPSSKRSDDDDDDDDDAIRLGFIFCWKTISACPSHSSSSRSAVITATSLHDATV